MKLYIEEKPSLERAVATGIKDGKNCDGYKTIREKILNSRMEVEEPKSYIGTSHTTIASYVHDFQKNFFKQHFDLITKNSFLRSDLTPELYIILGE